MTRYASLNDLPPAMRAQVAARTGGNPLPFEPGSPEANALQAKPRKYRNQPVVIDGERFDSKLEGRCYSWLKLRMCAGDVRWFVRQVSFRLEGGVKYRCDFIACLMAGGVEVIDAKGMLTESSRNKIKQVKERYGIDVVLWRGE